MAKKKQNDSGIEATRILSRRNLIGVIVGSIFAAVAAISVSIINKEPKIPPTETQTFVGRVYNRKNPSEKIANAVVVMEGESVPPFVTTDSQGLFSVPLRNSKKEHRIKLEVDGYEPFDLRVVPANRNDIQPIPLMPLSAPQPQIKTNGNQNSLTYSSPTSNPTPVNEFRPQNDLPRSISRPAENVVPGSPLTITALQAIFHSGNQGKDRENSISETFTMDGKILGQNRFWGRSTPYRENSVDKGEEFPVNIPYSDCHKLKYTYSTNTTSGWDVAFEIKAKLSDGSTRTVARSGVSTVGKGLPDTRTMALCSDVSP